MTNLEKIELEGVLQKWAEFTIERFQQTLDRLKIGITKDLFFSFVKEVTRHNGDVDGVVIKFLNYGRFPDMGVGNGVSLNDLVANRRAYGRYRQANGRLHDPISRRKKKWYSKILYKRFAELKYVLPPEIADQLGMAIREQLQS